MAFVVRIHGCPGMIASVITLVLILVLFKPSKAITINLDGIEEKRKALGRLTAIEKRTTVWMIIATVLWMTDSIHGINAGRVTFGGIAMCMNFPGIGGVLTIKSWSQIPVHVLVFLTSAMAIGSAGEATGMNIWLANTILPEKLPDNLFALALLIAAVAIVIHMLMGSVIAVMVVIILSLLIATQSLGVPQIAIVLLVYMSIASHYILPFHHLNMVVGQGEEAGMYTQKETIRFGIPFTAIIFDWLSLKYFGGLSLA